VGQTVEVLVEGASKRDDSKMSGRSRDNRIVIFEGNQRHRGQLLQLRVTRATARALYGQLPLAL
jgi:tRNA-2-methylthio-N6-dimethylallyladenosine synthase